METFQTKNHWEKIYQTKQQNEVSWHQSTPQTSLDFIKQFNVPAKANIIDVGGGDSLLVDHLLNKGYRNITVLDISEKAIERAKQRLGVQAKKVKWIIADVTKFHAIEKYDFWHDRAAFHFLTTAPEITDYIKNAERGISRKGLLVIGTFSEQGPEKCSGIHIKQYSEKSMAEQFKEHFKKIRCINTEHITPFETVQKFVFCSFRKQSAND